ncbi:tRNA (adenine(58)-N(1))-methyltransferase, mitochondrial [Salminus brasiliensis]|uniref:tRNA (adenine(58)-N(1))-methyltransferase, mitochondrial n=1 Tax=Salminus brasiliensis TaxID=930266 RepID=UPI003B837AA8
MTHRLARVCASCLRQRRLTSKYTDARIAPAAWSSSLRSFGTAPDSSDENDGGREAPASAPPGSAQFSGFGRRRPLSPLERVSQLLPQDSLSKEVWELRENKSPEEAETEEQAQNGSTVGADQPDIQSSSPEDHVGDVDVPVQDAAETQEQGRRAVGTERTMCFGEFILVLYRRNQRLEFRKMFQLRNGGKLESSWGSVPHQAIAGQPAGSVLRSSMGLPMLFRRPSLEEFTLFMKRGPAIAYPKDANAMLMMMDVNEGDSVLESGSGSGAMSLFLSRAVGCRGRVLSVEIREDHHRRSVLNFQHWRSTWKLHRGEEWPDNVHFQLGDLVSSSQLLAGQSFNSVALDMVNPHLSLPTVVPHLHSGAVCAVYLANITQIVDLLEGLRCSDVPLVCERIIEVQYKDWLLAPSCRKDGTFNKRRPVGGESVGSEEDDGQNDEEKEELARPKQEPFGSIPYIARPHPEQLSHTAFLVKLRKILK